VDKSFSPVLVVLISTVAELFKPRCTASIRQKFFVDRVIYVWNALLSTVNFTSLNVLGTALKRLTSLVISFVIFYLYDRIRTQ